MQINLLPDVKRDYLRSQQTKHMVLVSAVLASAVAVGLLVLLFAYVQLIQPQHRRNVQADIDSGLNELKKQPDAVEIVTVQGALEQLPKLQDQKQLSSRLFSYLNSFTPREVGYSQVNLDLKTNQLTVTGSATSYEQANVLANNLKSASFSYTQNDAQKSLKPFSAVVFQSLSRSQGTNNKPVSFQLSFKLNPILFNQTAEAGSLQVDATSSELLLPTDQVFSAEQPLGGAQ